MPRPSAFLGKAQDPGCCQRFVNIRVTIGLQGAALSTSRLLDACPRWDTERCDWLTDPRAYDIVIAASTDDIRSVIRVEVTA